MDWIIRRLNDFEYTLEHKLHNQRQLIATLERKLHQTHRLSCRRQEFLDERKGMHVWENEGGNIKTSELE